MPPPSSVVGMFLSLLGRERGDLPRYHDDRCGLAVRLDPERSTVLRRMRRDPANPKEGQRGMPLFRPETQELIADLRFWACLEGRLADEVADALASPVRIDRYGAVSLGESAFLVDSIREVEAVPEDAVVLRPDKAGPFSLTVFVDFTDRTRTRHQRFTLAPGPLEAGDCVPVGGAMAGDGSP